MKRYFASDFDKIKINRLFVQRETIVFVQKIKIFF